MSHTPTLCTVLDSKASQDDVRAALDIAAAADGLAALPASPFAKWLVKERGMEGVIWTSPRFQTILNPVKISRRITSPRMRFIAYGATAASVAVMTANLLKDTESEVIAARPCGKLPPGVAGTLPQPLPFRYDILLRPEKSESPTMVYFGEITPESHLETAVEALNLLRDTGLRLRVAGTGAGRNVFPAVKLARRLGVDERIDWLGEIDALHEEVALCTFAYIPESDSPKATTAAGCGTPIVSSPTPQGLAREIATALAEPLSPPPCPPPYLAMVEQICDNMITSVRK